MKKNIISYCAFQSKFCQEIDGLFKQGTWEFNEEIISKVLPGLQEVIKG